MEATSVDSKKADCSNKEPLFAWTALREFILLTLAFSGGYLLLDLYANGQSIRKYLLQGAFISAALVLLNYGRKRTQHNQKSKSYLHPDN